MKNKLIILQVFIVMVLVCTSVYAAIDTQISVKVSKSTVNRGDTVDVTLSLENVNKDQKIKNVEGYINYDKNVLEKVTFDSIVKDNNNKITIGEEKVSVENANGNMSASAPYLLFNDSPSDASNDIKILIDLNNSLTKDTELVTIRFKVKETADLKEIKDAITYKFVAKGEGANDKTVESEEMIKGVTLTVEKKAATQQPTDDNKNDNNKDDDKKNETKNDDNSVGKVNGNTNKNNANNSANNTNTVDNTVSGVGLPATGAKVFIIPVVVLIALAYISYNKYVRMRGI